MDKKYKERLKGKFFHLLCEREEKREWEKFHRSIHVELVGINDRYKTEFYHSLMSKFNMLTLLKFDIFRSTIFECIALIDKL